MKCNHCSNPASIFLTRVEGDALKKIALCESCAEDPDLIAEQGLEQLLGLPSPPPELSTSRPEQVEIQCRCGFTMENISKIGRLGCPLCYDTFESVITGRIESIHRGTKHVGKTIEIEMSDDMLERKQNRLLEALNTAIESEQFETAAQLRDEIEAIKNQLAC